jgi:hypothetical protein
MKNIMIVVILMSVRICCAGENVAHNCVGVPLQVPVVAAMAIAAAHGNNGQLAPQKPKHSARPLAKKELQNHPRKQKDHSTHHRHGYSQPRAGSKK